MPSLLLGPLVRYVGETEATVWVETDGPTDVEILGASQRTFSVCGRHYALVHVEGLEPGSINPYEVRLDSELAWPPPDWPYPPSVIRTAGGAAPISIAFGSCRVSAPHEPPFTLSKDAHEQGREEDALRALTERMRHRPPDEWPHVLLFVGDQVYADEL